MAHVTDLYDYRTCKRCGGTEEVLHISNLDGGRCYGCGGKGKVLTARGQKDYQRYLDARKAAMIMKRPAELTPGDKIKVYSEGRGPWYTVESVKEEDIVQNNGRRLIAVTLPDYNMTPYMWPDQLVWVFPGNDKLPKPAAFDSRKQQVA